MCIPKCVKLSLCLKSMKSQILIETSSCWKGKFTILPRKRQVVLWFPSPLSVKHCCNLPLTNQNHYKWHHLNSDWWPLDFKCCLLTNHSISWIYTSSNLKLVIVAMATSFKISPSHRKPCAPPRVTSCTSRKSWLSFPVIHSSHQWIPLSMNKST